MSSSLFTVLLIRSGLALPIGASLAEEKGVLEFRDGVDLAKLQNASLGKKRTGVKNLRELYEGGLGYLEPSAGLFADI